MDAAILGTVCTGFLHPGTWGVGSSLFPRTTTPRRSKRSTIPLFRRRTSRIALLSLVFFFQLFAFLYMLSRLLLLSSTSFFMDYADAEHDTGFSRIRVLSF